VTTQEPLKVGSKFLVRWQIFEKYAIFIQVF